MHHPKSPLPIRKEQLGHALKKHPRFPVVFSQGDILAALLSAAPLIKLVSHTRGDKVSLRSIDFSLESTPHVLDGNEGKKTPNKSHSRERSWSDRTKSLLLHFFYHLNTDSLMSLGDATPGKSVPPHSHLRVSGWSNLCRHLESKTDKKGSVFCHFSDYTYFLEESAN